MRNRQEPDKQSVSVRKVRGTHHDAPEGCKIKMILQMVHLGCGIIPVVPYEKKPAIKNWVNNASKNEKEITEFFSSKPTYNYGVLTGAASGIFVVDLDGTEGIKSWRRLQKLYGGARRTVTVQSPNGLHLYFRTPKHRVGNSTSKVAKGIDIRGDGGQVVGPGSETLDGVYRFKAGRGPDEVEIAEAPGWLLEMLAPGPSPANESAKPAEIPEKHRERALKYADAACKRELDRLSKAPNHQRNGTLNRCAWKLGQFLPHGLLNRSSLVDQLERVALQVGLEPPEIRPTIESGLKAGSRHPRRLPFLKNPGKQSPLVVLPTDNKPDGFAERLAKLGETDTDNAERFATRFGRKTIYTKGRGWLVFDGTRYKPDATLEVMELAKKTARAIRAELRFKQSDQERAARIKFARESLSKGALERMLELAKSLLAVKDDTLDADPMLFNTLSGTIDLRTGRLEKHDSRDLLTKVAPVHARPHADCPLFKKFLRQVTDGDKELMRYIQKCMGYTLTGDISEQVLFFLYGPGNTGKSTLINTIRDMMGDYGAHTPTETLLVKQYDNAIPADLARLAGARMVSAVEANVNRHLDEARIKGITGGEPITARFMRQNFFEFHPVLKLWIAANDRPRVRSTDAAFWRRVRVLPCLKEVPESERDRHLYETLKAEWPGILRFAVRGCLKWQAEGLIEPASVRRATSDWRAEVDHLRMFVEEVVDFGPEHRVQASPMYQAYSQWCRQNGEHRLPVNLFNAKLCEMFDLTHKRIHGRSWWIGAKIKP